MNLGNLYDTHNKTTNNELYDSTDDALVVTVATKNSSGTTIIIPDDLFNIQSNTSDLDTITKKKKQRRKKRKHNIKHCQRNPNSVTQKEAAMNTKQTNENSNTNNDSNG